MSEHDGSEIDELGVTLGSQKDAQLKQSPYMASVSALDADASATADAAADAPAEDAVVCPPATASATPSDPRPLASSATPPPPPPAAADAAAAAETASEAAESAAGFAAAGGSGAFSAVPRPPSSAAAGQGEASAGLPAPASVPVSAVPSGVLSELPPPSRGLEEEAFDAPEAAAAAAAASRVLEEEAGGEAAACRSQVEEEEAEQPPPPPVASEGAPSRASSRRASCVAEDDASTQGSFRGDAVSAGVGSRRASHASEIASYHYNCDESESHQTDCIISERKQRSAQSASQQAPSQQVASSLPFPDDIPSPAIPAPYAASSQPRPSPTPTPQDVRSSPAVQPLSAQSSKRLPTGYDSQPQPPANSVHEGLVSAMAAPSQRQPPPAALRRVSSPYTDASASAGRRSATPPQHRPAAARSAADSPVAAAASPSPVQPPPPSQYQQQQQQQQQPSPAAAARRADPVFDAACALWDAREQRLREARAAKEAQQRRAESEHGRKLRMMDEVRHLQQNERRTQFHARERYPAQRFDTTVASPQRQTKVASLDTTASYSMYKDVYGVVPHSADVYRETVGSSSSPAPAGRDGASPSPQRRSRSREPSQPGAAQSPPHGMSTLQHTRSILERSRLQPDSENSLDAIARLKRLKKISSASSTLLTSCPRSPQTPGRAGGRVPAGSPTGLRCLNPRHPEWRIAQDGTFLLPDGTPANVLDHLRGFRR